jgi:hypothetical protein
LNPARLVFLDGSEHCFERLRDEHDPPLRPQPARATPVPHGRWNLVAGLRHDGIVAPLVIDHPMNGVTFRACVEQHLAPTLSPGDFVVTDNLQGRKAPGVRATIGQCLARFTAAGCSNYLANSGYPRLM